MWVVDKFQDIHNHPLTTTPSKYHRTNLCKSLVADLNNEGLKPSQITRVVNAMKPSEEADVTPRQCSSIIRVKRKNNAGRVDLNEKYNLKGNFWIQNVYNLCAHWAKSFLNDTFLLA
ncbi:hypothetical protein RJ640_016839 [Escallonia rubra]|uniref:Protein FAR1-RELATED SEQUENCE n=1 Tax=Escallonia rubra TaxID=112253 RepID=A0AA88S3K3_9ASTE|nr:hypothetical protein RJ640_016839 [Escallonia rubra]